MSGVRTQSRRRARGDRAGGAGAAVLRLTAAVGLCATLVGGCSGEEAEDTPALPKDPGSAFVQSAAALRARDTFTFEASFTRVKATAPDDVEEYATAEGALYLAHDEGGAVLELAPLFPGQEESPLGEPVQLRWTAEALTVVLDEKEPSCTRRSSRRSTGRGSSWKPGSRRTGSRTGSALRAT
jgi:hypothetical protein